MNSYETTNLSRDQVLMLLIEQSRAELQLQPISTKELEKTKDAWLRRLSFIPTERLQRCFDVALERQERRASLVPNQILEAWKIVSAELQNLKRNQPRESCEFGCTVDGWVTVNADGSLWSGGFGETFAKPCPAHRPQGWRVGEMTNSNFQRNSPGADFSNF